MWNYKLIKSWVEATKQVMWCAYKRGYDIVFKTLQGLSWLVSTSSKTVRKKSYMVQHRKWETVKKRKLLNSK